MSEIKQGDLVVAVRGYPKCGNCAGFVFTVFDFDNIGSRCRCGWQSDREWRIATYGDGERGVPVTWLKKLDPPATGEYDGVPVRKIIKHKEPA